VAFDFWTKLVFPSTLVRLSVWTGNRDVRVRQQASASIVTLSTLRRSKHYVSDIELQHGLPIIMCAVSPRCFSHIDRSGSGTVHHTNNPHSTHLHRFSRYTSSMSGTTTPTKPHYIDVTFGDRVQQAVDLQAKNMAKKETSTKETDTEKHKRGVQVRPSGG
jgi:hypothetical protein